jgi:hypothetical protein
MRALPSVARPCQRFGRADAPLPSGTTDDFSSVLLLTAAGYLNVIVDLVCYLAGRMQTANQMKAGLNSERNIRFTASILISALLLALTLAAAPQLHARIHKDSSATDHQCAATLISSGSYEHSASPDLLSTPQLADHVSTIAIFTSCWVPALFLGASIFEHAPPARS